MSKKNAAPDISEATAQENGETADHLVNDPSVKVGDDPSPGDEVVSEEDPTGMIIRLQEELEEQKDQQLRAIAEAENVRRRADTDVVNSRKFAVETFARELLTVRDSLELASTVVIDAGHDEVVVKMEEGLQLTLKQMDQVFEKFDISEVVAEPGIKPDPAIHQPMSLIDSDEVNSGEIVSVMQKGYRLHDRLLRPAMVLVAK